MISLHIIIDNATDAQLDRGLRYLKRTNQKLVNIAAGAQLDRGMAYVERVRAEVPGIKVFWRHLEDTGIWRKLNPLEWWVSRVTDRLSWAQRNDIIFVTDNESSGDDTTIQNYVRWQKSVMEQLHEKGLHAAVGRFATGNILEEQYTLLKPMFDCIQPGDYFSPNEYFNAPGKSSGGHLFRYDLGWKAAGHALPTAIGEFAMAVDYKSDKGYRSIGMSGKDFAALAIQQYEAWYETRGVTVFLYCIGGYGWELFQLDDEVLTALETYALSKAQPAAPPASTPITVRPVTPVKEEPAPIVQPNTTSEPPKEEKPTEQKPAPIDLQRDKVIACLRALAAEILTLADVMAAEQVVG